MRKNILFVTFLALGIVMVALGFKTMSITHIDSSRILYGLQKIIMLVTIVLGCFVSAVGVHGLFGSTILSLLIKNNIIERKT